MKKYEFIYGAIKADGEKQVYGAINKGISEEDPALVNLSQYKDEFKLVYAKDGKIFGSKSGIPAEGDVEIIEIEALYEEIKAEEEVPAHEHIACEICEKCTDEDCTGTEEEKCAGHETSGDLEEPTEEPVEEPLEEEVE
jgi:hypothetical protein